MNELRAREVRVNTLGFLANNLRGYEPASILREQLQNADDASHKQSRRGELRLEFLLDRLVVTNPSIFSEEDWERLLEPNSRGKFGDADQTGEFGVGFWGSLHLTDAPIVTSGSSRVVLDPRNATEETVDWHEGTKVEFVYRRERTDLGEKLDAALITPEVEARMATTFVHQMAELLLFTRAIDTITIQLPDGSLRSAARAIDAIRGEVHKLTVSVDGAPAEDCQYLIVRTTVASPPAGHHGRVTVALPLTPHHRGLGRAFFMFPTETVSGLHVSVDAHFWATDDRRSLENSGPHGAWNDRIFEEAGRAVGRALETVLDPAVHGLDIEDAISWFTPAGSQLPDIARRAGLFTAQLDTEARQRAVIPDRSGRLQRGLDLVSLPPELEPLLSEAIGYTARPSKREATSSVYRLWGLATWGAAEVASWLKERLPSVITPRTEAPAFVRDTDSALTLLEFCRGQERTLQGMALLLGTDDAYHPIGGGLSRPADDHQHLVIGLARPLVTHEYLGSWAAQFAPLTSPQWIREALIESAAVLVGKRVPLSTVGAASKQQHVSETLTIVGRAAGGFDGVPLAMDEDSRLQVFDDQTVVGLPDSNRPQAERLARRLGLCPLHKSIDDGTVSQAGHRFSVSLINELIPGVTDWDPAEDSRLLVEVLGTIAHEGSTSAVLIEQVRSQQIWKGSDGGVHALRDLRLPARDRIARSNRTLVSNDLVGNLDPSSPVYSTLKGLLRVDVLDTTEEVVLACEEPPIERIDRRQLLIDLGDCERLSRVQVERLQHSPFVLCRDGHLRKPAETLLTIDRLPLRLGDRCVDDEAGRDRRVRERLKELGAQDLPGASDLLDAAAEISRLPVASDPAADPSRILWDHLLRHHDRYPPSSLNELASVAWLLTLPGPARREPKDCYDPLLSFAALLFPVPPGVGTPPQAFRDALRMKATLETDDCVKLGRRAAEDQHTLDRQYFVYINRRCERGESDGRQLARLRTVSIVPLTSGLTTPESLVSRQRAGIWGHLRSLVPEEFVADYPNLVRAWGLATEGQGDWLEHLDVLDELARRPEFDGRDRALASERLRSITGLSLDDHQLETIRLRAFLLTSLGLRPFSEVLRGDLPPAVVTRLAGLLPIVEESADTADFFDRLDVRSLRSAIILDPIVQGARSNDRWPEILRRHADNVLRFLKASGARLDRALLEAWPPIVKGVASLAVRASFDGEVLDEWKADAHLSQEGAELVLYVSGHELETRAVVDAISSEFAVDRGRKTLLLGILNASSAQEGGGLLDWDNIPQLTNREHGYLHEHEETSVIFANPTVTEQPSNGDDVHDEDRIVGEDEPDDHEEGHAGLSHADANDLADKRPGVPIAEVGHETADASGPATTTTETDVDSSGGSFDTTLIRSPKGITNVESLEDQGIVIIRDLDVEPVEEDYRPSPAEVDDEPTRDEVRVCLSFFDVSEGLIPISSRDLTRLTSNVALREVELFGETVPAQAAAPRHVRLEHGANIFYSRQVVPGTVMRVHPSVPGKVEIEVRPDLHQIDGVWMLEFDDFGKLTRLKQDDVELHWETDDAFYRAERRLEDIQALMADGGKSAVQLIIEVFLARPNQGLTADEVWGLVAISRLFAKATISQTLSSQTGLFEHRDGLWYKTGDKLRMFRSTGRPGSVMPGTPTRPNQVPEAVRLARKLGQLLVGAEADTLLKVVQLLGIQGLLQDSEFAQSCALYIETSDAEVLAAIEREILGDPGRAGLVVQELERLTTTVLGEQRALLDLVVCDGSAAAVIRAKTLLTRLDSITGIVNDDPFAAAEQILVAFAEGATSETQLWESVGRMWKERKHADPLTDSAFWLDYLAAMEEVDRRAAQQSTAPQSALDARGVTIGWLSAQLAGEVYVDQDVQCLRVVIDLLVGKPSEFVLDGLHQLGLLAEKSPGAEGDAALLYALVVAHARQASIQSSLVQRSQKRLDALKGPSASASTRHFADLWAKLGRVPMTDVLRLLEA